MHAKQRTMNWSLCMIHALPTNCWYWQLLSGQNVNRKSRKRGDGQERGDKNYITMPQNMRTSTKRVDELHIFVHIIYYFVSVFNNKNIDDTVSVKCRATMNAKFLYFNSCLCRLFLISFTATLAYTSPQ